MWNVMYLRHSSAQQETRFSTEPFIKNYMEMEKIFTRMTERYRGVVQL